MSGALRRATRPRFPPSAWTLTRHGIRGVAARRFRPVTTDSRHGLPIAPDLLGQGFQAPAPNRVWLGDITYIATEEGWLYLAPRQPVAAALRGGSSALPMMVLDLATRKVVGLRRSICRSPSLTGPDRARCARWAMREHLRTELVSAALLMAAQRQRPTKGLIIHSDRGSQYASKPYRTLLEGWGMRQSMGRKGCCFDNAPMESFFHTLKVELVHRERFASREEAKRELFADLEGYYNRQRLHSALGYRTPEHAERLAA